MSSGSVDLSLSDFLDRDTLQEIQDSFCSVTRLITSIRGADGQTLTTPTDTQRRDASDILLDQLIDDGLTENISTDQKNDPDSKNKFTAPIMLNGQKLGSIVIEHPDAFVTTIEASEPQKAKFLELGRTLGMDEDQSMAMIRKIDEVAKPNRAASVQFLHLIANSITRLCEQEYQNRLRAAELNVLFNMSRNLAGAHELSEVLRRATEEAGKALKVKSVSIRLRQKTMNEAGEHVPAEDLFLPVAVYGLSEEYIQKGPIVLKQSPMYQRAMKGEVVYIADMTADDRVVYREDAEREGLKSMLCCALNYQDRIIGTIQLFSETSRQFTDHEIDIVRAVSDLLATAIETTRLHSQRHENQRMMRQLQLGAAVQRRLLPSQMPHFPGLDIAARYVPSFELGGDFYDFIELDGHLGLAIGDVVGKGVGASLLMASSRSALRAYAQDLYDLDDIIGRVNVTMTRDTTDSEFVTLWYGVVNPHTMRLTYCNAGHEAPLLVRDGKLIPLDVGGMIIGVDDSQAYEKSVIDLKKNDVLLMYTDGLGDAMNDHEEKFGTPRIQQALLDVVASENEAKPLRAGDIVHGLLKSIRDFTGKRRSIDDTTVVVVKVTDDAPDVYQGEGI